MGSEWRQTERGGTSDKPTLYCVFTMSFILTLFESFHDINKIRSRTIYVIFKIEGNGETAIWCYLDS